jgi:hypothetical protein
MVLISIQPFAFRKILLVIAVMVCFSAICLADPVLMVHRYAAPVEQFHAPRTAGHDSQQPRYPYHEASNGFAFSSGPSVDSFVDTSALTLGQQPFDMGLVPSVFHQKMCELRLTSFQNIAATSLFAMSDQD